MPLFAIDAYFSAIKLVVLILWYTLTTFHSNSDITHFKVTCDIHAFRSEIDMLVYCQHSPPPPPLTVPPLPLPSPLQVYYQQGSSRQYQVSDWQGQGYVVLDGLDPNTEYYVNVTAVTDTFESDANNGLRVVTQTDTGEVLGN